MQSGAGPPGLTPSPLRAATRREASARRTNNRSSGEGPALAAAVRLPQRAADSTTKQSRLAEGSAVAHGSRHLARPMTTIIWQDCWCSDLGSGREVELIEDVRARRLPVGDIGMVEVAHKAQPEPSHHGLRAFVADRGE